MLTNLSTITSTLFGVSQTHLNVESFNHLIFNIQYFYQISALYKCAFLWHIRKMGPTRIFGGTRDPGLNTWVGPATLKVRLKTRDLYYTRDLKHRTLKVGPGTLIIVETQNPKQTFLVEPGTHQVTSNQIKSNQVTFMSCK